MGFEPTVQRSPSVKACCRGSNIVAETAVRQSMFLPWFLCGEPHTETNRPFLGRVLYRSHRPAFETEYWRNRPQGRERHRPFLRACSAEAQDLASSPKSHFRSVVTRKRDKTILIPIAGPLQNHILSLPTSDDPKSPIHPKRKPSDDLAPGTKNSILKQAGLK